MMGSGGGKESKTSQEKLGAARAVALCRKWRMHRAWLLSRLVRMVTAWKRSSPLPVLWPTFLLPEQAEGLATVLDRASHYLEGTGARLEYFTDGRDGLRRHTVELATLNEQIRPASPLEAKNASLSARYLLAWAESKPPRMISLRPHLYTVAEIQNHYPGLEWARLLWDLTAPHASRAPMPRKVPTTPRARVALLGSGPSLEIYKRNVNKFDGFIALNYVACDDEIGKTGVPLAIVALDPWYFEPSAMGSDFWLKTMEVVRDTAAIFVTAYRFEPYLSRHFPAAFLEKCHFVRTPGLETLGLFLEHDLSGMTVPHFGNVLLDLGLPIAAAMSRRISIFGCDGRDPALSGLNFQKAPGQDAHEAEMVEAHPVHPSGTFIDGQIESFYEMTRVVVADCLRRRIRISICSHSFNSGLAGLPLDEDLIHD